MAKLRTLKTDEHRPRPQDGAGRRARAVRRAATTRGATRRSCRPSCSTSSGSGDEPTMIERTVDHDRRRPRARSASARSPTAAPRAAMVLCHPHPQYGGTMRCIVIGALFEALPAARRRRACASTSAASRAARVTYGHGHDEQHDAAPRSRALTADLALGRRRAARPRGLVVRRRHRAHHRRRCRSPAGSRSRRRCGSSADFSAVARRPAAEAPRARRARRVPRRRRR